MKLVVAFLLIGLPTLAHAQQLGERIPGQRASAGLPKGANAGRVMRPCPQYGPGFVKLDGSSACVRIGGQVRYEYGAGGGGARDSFTGTRSGATVELDARAETDLGPLRAVVRGGGNAATGAMQNQRW